MKSIKNATTDMKKLLKAVLICFLMIVVSSCSAKSTELSQLSGKTFANSEKIILIVDKNSIEVFPDLKENQLVLFDLKDINNFKIYSNTKITKKNSTEYLTADDLKLNIEVIDAKTLKDVENNLEYKESEVSILDSFSKPKKVEITDDIRKISNKSFISDSGNEVIFSLYENGQTALFIKEKGTNRHYNNANLKIENGKTYIIADGLTDKYIYSSINVIINENTNTEYKLR